MAQIVVVHGVGHHKSTAEAFLAVVEPALHRGLAAAGHAPLQPGAVTCAFYGDVFLSAGARGIDLPPWDENDVEDGLESELLAAWWEYAASIDPSVPPPDAEGTRGLIGYAASRPLHVRRVREALDALSGSAFFAGHRDRVLIFALKQVRMYLTDPATKAAARARVSDSIGPDTTMIIGHSLGSIVAYESLAANPDWPVTSLITLGSPLGMRSIVFDRLDPAPVDGRGAWPGGLTRWTNLADGADIVAMVHHLAPRFSDRIDDVPVNNRTHMHDLDRYLEAEQTGNAIHAGLRAQ